VPEEHRAQEGAPEKRWERIDMRAARARALRCCSALTPHISSFSEKFVFRLAFACLGEFSDDGKALPL
jgi:hypothetical protein